MWAEILTSGVGAEQRLSEPLQCGVLCLVNQLLHLGLIPLRCDDAGLEPPTSKSDPR